MASLTPFLGEIAALGTAFLWANSAICFTSASNKIGVVSTNRYRTTLAAVFLTVIHLFVFRNLIPGATQWQLGLLISSGIVGLVIGDTFLLQSYVDLGPRLTMLIFNISPFFTALFAKLFLHEKIQGMVLMAMIVTLSGTIWVLLEENSGKNTLRRKHFARGITFAILAAAGQSLGYIMSKPAITGAEGLPVLSATLIRIVAATMGFWVLSFLNGSSKKIFADIKNKKAMLPLAMGSFMGPCLGVWTSLIALKLIPAGVAATLIATIPVIILPVAFFVYKEKISWRAVLGTIITVIGVAMLFHQTK